MKKMLQGILATAVALAMSGCYSMHTISNGMSMMGDFDTLSDKSQKGYVKMIHNIGQYGDPARAMMIEAKIADDVTNDDAVDAIKAITEERNMRVTGDVKMFTKEDAKPDEVKHARIISVCNLTTAKIFLNYSRWYGGFMPCRIMLIEYGNGDRYLVTMDLDMAINGGKTLPPEMLKAALKVKDTMETLIKSGAEGDF